LINFFPCRNESEGSYKSLEQLTLNQLEKFHPNSRLIRNRTVINNQTSLKSADEWQQYEKKTNSQRLFSFFFNLINRFEDEVHGEFDSDTDVNDHSQLAEQYRLNADQFLTDKNYQQAVILYTKSLKNQKNPMVYMNRAIAC